MPTLESTTGQEDARLALAAQEGDDDALNTLARRYYFICEAQAKKAVLRFRKLGLDADDILSGAAHPALLRAVQKYDPSRGAGFNHFLTICVRTEINSLYRQEMSKRGLSDEKRFTLRSQARAFHALEQRELRQATPIERKAIKMGKRPHDLSRGVTELVSIDQNSGRTDLNGHEILADDRPNALTKLIANESRMILAGIVRSSFTGKDVDRDRNCFARHVLEDEDVRGLGDKHGVTGSAIHLRIQKVRSNIRIAFKNCGLSLENVSLQTETGLTIEEILTPA